MTVRTEEEWLRKERSSRKERENGEEKSKV